MVSLLVLAVVSRQHEGFGRVILQAFTVETGGDFLGYFVSPIKLGLGDRTVKGGGHDPLKALDCEDERHPLEPDSAFAGAALEVLGQPCVIRVPKEGACCRKGHELLLGYC